MACLIDSGKYMNPRKLIQILLRPKTACTQTDQQLHTFLGFDER